MRLFNFFNKNNNKNQASANENPLGLRKELFAESTIDSEVLLNNGKNGLEGIYNFLQFDYESRGYNDALTNPDESYKADNIKLFNHDLFILIDKTGNYYENLLKEINFHISSRSRAGLIDLVEELKIRKEMVSDHLEKLKAIRTESMTGEGAVQRIGLSYQRGFMRGLSAISQSKLFNRNL